MSAKAKGVAHGHVNGFMTSLEGSVVEIAIWVLIYQIDGGWNYAVLHG